MIILDTDHVGILQLQSPQASRLAAKIDALPDVLFVTTAITAEEQMRGWLALIHRTNDVYKQLSAYDQFIGLFQFFAKWKVLPFDQAAADEFVRLRALRVRIATMDLKIAATALASDATLLSANTRDFERVPNLRLENWLR